MSFSSRRTLLASSSASLLLCAFGGAALAQDTQAPAATGATALPEITVTAPSPIVRRKLVPSPKPVRVARTAAPAIPRRRRSRTRL